MPDDVTNDQTGTEVTGGSSVQSGDQGAPVGDQAGAAAVGTGGIEVGGERFSSDQDVRKAYAELRKAYTQHTQTASTERKANEWLVNRLKEIQTGSPEDWNTLKGLLNGVKRQQAAAQAGAGQAQPLADPRVDSLVQEQALAKAELEIFKFQKNHPEVPENKLQGLVQFILENDVKGKNYSLEDAFIITSHSDLLAQAKSAGQKQAEDAVRKGQGATALGTGATTAQQKQKSENFFKIKDENTANARIDALLKKHNVRFDD